LRRANERRPTCDRARVDWVLAAWRAPEPEPLIKSGRGHVRDFLMARRTSRNAPRRPALAEQRGRRPAQRSRGAGRSRVCQNPARARPTGAPLGASKRARAVAVGRLDHIGTVEKKKPRRVGSVLRRAGVEGEGGTRGGHPSCADDNGRVARRFRTPRDGRRCSTSAGRGGTKWPALRQQSSVQPCSADRRPGGET
jgi:hypothetical protein